MQDLLGEVSALGSLSKFDELDDITLDLLTSAVHEWCTITIELFHCVEIGLTYSNDDYRASFVR